jgi:hypothetical protein
VVVIPFQAPRILQGQSPPMDRSPKSVEPTARTAQRLRAQHARRLAHYQELRDFYGGMHFTHQRPGRSQLVANYARAIVDKHVAFCFARGVGFQESAGPTARRGRAGPAAERGRAGRGDVPPSPTTGSRKRPWRRGHRSSGAEA